MYSTALIPLLPTLTDEEREQLLANAALMSLYEALRAIPYPRPAHRLRYDLFFLLTCLMAALLLLSPLLLRPPPQ